MAVKNHALDQTIIDAAREEFLNLGFQKASLHQIAEKAGITTGALYTRYRSKDALFCSLIGEAFFDIESAGDPAEDRYAKAQNTLDADQFLEAMRAESRFYMDLAFREYDTCILLFCRSEGSSVQEWLQKKIEKKSQETVAFFESISKNPVDKQGILLILQEQMHYYRMILEKGRDKEQALACLATVETFLEGGWKALFQQMF